MCRLESCSRAARSPATTRRSFPWRRQHGKRVTQSRSPPTRRSSPKSARPASRHNRPAWAPRDAKNGPLGSPGSIASSATRNERSSSPRSSPTSSSRRVPADLERIVSSWRPDLVVHEIAELAAPLVCTAAGVPYVDVGYGSLVPLSILEAAGAAAAQHWRTRRPRAGPFRRAVPAPLRRHVPAVDGNRRDQHDRSRATELAARGRGLARRTNHVESASIRRPLVYVTMGTVWNHDLGMFQTNSRGARRSTARRRRDRRTHERSRGARAPTAQRLGAPLDRAGRDSPALRARDRARRSGHDARRPGARRPAPRDPAGRRPIQQRRTS